MSDVGFDQEQLDRAIAQSIHEQEQLHCSQTAAFLTDRDLSLPASHVPPRNGLPPLRSSPTQPPLPPPSANISRFGARIGIPSSYFFSNNNNQNSTSNNNNGRYLSSQFNRLMNTVPSPFAISSMLCRSCMQPIIGSQLTAMGNNYHPRCFVCAGCFQPFNGQFCPKGDPPEPYHQQCLEELYGERCCLCNEILRGQYLKHPFFANEKYCVGHQTTSRSCFSCQRREPVPNKTKKEGFVDLPDGRASCMDCISQAVFDSEGARPLYLEAVDFIENVLGLTIPTGMRDVPVLAVDLSSLNEQQQYAAVQSHREQGLGSGATSGIVHLRPTDTRTNSHGMWKNITTGGGNAMTGGSRTNVINNANIVRGLTLSEVSSIRHVTPGLYRYHPIQGGIGGGRFGPSFYGMGHDFRNPSSSSSYETIYCPRVTVTHSRSVTAVLVLFGLPKDLTASILVHEALHVWFKLTEHMPSPLSDDVSIEEGLCQYASMRYLEYLHGVDGDRESGWIANDEIPPPTVGNDEHQWESVASTSGNHSSSSSSGSNSGSNSGRNSSNRGSVGGGGSFGGNSRTQPFNPLDTLSYCQEIPSTSTNYKNKSKTNDSNHSSSSPSLTRTLRALFRSQIEMDESIVYGGGYRSVAPCCSALGLDIVLDHVRNNRRLPQV